MKILGQEITFNAQGESGTHWIEVGGIAMAFKFTLIGDQLDVYMGVGELRSKGQYNLDMLHPDWSGATLDELILRGIFNPDIAKLITDKLK